MGFINRKRYYYIILACFFFSGFTGLVYEIIWSRMLQIVFGVTIYSITVVLVSFLLGLALGSHVIGHFSDRISRPIWTYGILELLIGLYCLLTPVFFEKLTSIYATLYAEYQFSLVQMTLIRFVLSGVVLFIPTFMMGGTLPVIIKSLFHQYDHPTKLIGRVYAVNLFGAMFGAGITGYVLLPRLNIITVLVLATSINTLIFLASVSIEVFLKKKPEESNLQISTLPTWMETAVDSAPFPFYNISSYVFLLVALLSGTVSFIYEIAWFRALQFFIGSSVYAFTTMLTTFISGLAIGSGLFSLLKKKYSELLLHIFVYSQIALGLSIIIGVYIFDKLMPLFGLLPVITFTQFILTKFLTAIVVMIIPTILIGLTFPLIATLYNRTFETVGSRIGRLYAVNTFGNVLGVMGATFLLIPWLGVQKSMIAGALLNMTVGSFFYASVISREILQKITVIVFGAIFSLSLAYLIPSWDKYKVVLKKTNFATSDNFRFPKIVFFKEGPSATVTVLEEGEKRYGLMINQRYQANNHSLLDFQRNLVHIPLLYHSNPEDVLFIGMGSGISAGTTLSYPVRQLETVELSVEVREASQKFFRNEANSLFENSRSKVIVDDGRNYLSLSPQKYDVIISYPEAFIVKGTSNLYTYEFFEACRGKLKENGVLAIGVNIGSTSFNGLRSVLKTLRVVFPYMNLWFQDYERDILVVASSSPLYIDFLTMVNQAEKMDFIQLFDNIPEKYFELLSLFYFSDKDVEKLVEDKNLSINTDNYPFLEYAVEFHTVTDVSQHRKVLNRYIKQVSEKPFPPLINEEKNAYYFSYTKGLIAFRDGKFKEALAAWENALSIRPDNFFLHFKMGRLFHVMGDKRRAKESYLKVLELSPSMAGEIKKLFESL